MSQNQQFDIFVPFRHPKMLLKAFGLWTTKESTLKYKIYGTFMHIFFVEFFLILESMYLTIVNDLLDFVKFLSIYSTNIVFCASTITLVAYRTEIYELFDILKECTQIYGVDEKFMGHVKRVNRLSKVLWFAAFLTTFVAAFVPLFTHKLADNLWTPWSLDVPLYFWLTVIYQDAVAIMASSKLWTLF
jgi:hypothetical protein